MSRYLVYRVNEHPGIQVRTDTNIIAIDGNETLERVVLESAEGESDVACVGLFSIIDADPASEWLSGCAALDDHQFVLTARSLTDDQLDDRWTALGRKPALRMCCTTVRKTQHAPSSMWSHTRVDGQPHGDPSRRLTRPSRPSSRDGRGTGSPTNLAPAP